MASVLNTTRAETDLDDIWLFIAADNLRAANALIDAIAESAARRAAHPLMGRARPSFEGGVTAVTRVEAALRWTKCSGYKEGRVCSQAAHPSAQCRGQEQPEDPL